MKVFRRRTFLTALSLVIPGMGLLPTEAAAKPEPEPPKKDVKKQCPFVPHCKCSENPRPADVYERVLKFPVLSVKQCDYCRGPVDRHEHLFQCRKCGSVGDLITGIMIEPYEYLVDRVGRKLREAFPPVPRNGRG